MGMTMTQKILAAHAGLDHVEAGQLIEAKLDVVMANDITGPMALPIIKQMSDHVFDKDKVVFVPDHFTPNKDIKSAENSKAIREYAKEQGLTWYLGYQIRGELQGDPRVREGAGTDLVFRAGQVRRGACDPAGGRRGDGRRVHHRRRFPHLYIWSAWSIFDRHGYDGRGDRHGDRRDLVQSAKRH